MKTLYLVRHAKSSRDDPMLADRERPLNDRGRHDAPVMGRRLARRGAKPDTIVSSPAVRALATARLIAKELGIDRARIVVDERLYATSADELLAVVRALDDRLDRAMLVGHNPEMTDLAQRLSAAIGALPTCAVAEFGFDTRSWADVGAIAPNKATLDTPKS